MPAKSPCTFRLFEDDESYTVKMLISVFVILVLIFELLWAELSTFKIVKKWVPKSIILILLGLVTGGISWIIAYVGLSGLSSIKEEMFGRVVASFYFEWFRPEYVFQFLLAPIILQASLELYSREFFLELDSILLYAIVGTGFNIAAIGFSLYGLYRNNDTIGMIGAEGDMIDFLIYAAILSAVDPVAVLSVFDELGVDKSLSVLILGESLLNDAVTVVFYEGLSRIRNLKTSLDGLGYFCVVASFFTTSLGGLVFGIIYGLFASLLCKQTSHRGETFEMVIVFGYAYLAFLNAQFVSWSGIMAVIGYGLITKRYTLQNLSSRSRNATKSAIKVLAHTSESIIFLLFGISAWSLTPDSYSVQIWFWSYFFCTVYRVISVCIIGVFINWSSDINILNKRTLCIMSWGGLRGAVSFVMAKHIKCQNSDCIIQSGTIFIILITCILQGGTIEFVVRGLRMFHPQEKTTMREKTMVDAVMWVSQRTMSGMAVILGGSKGRGTRLYKWIEILDSWDREFFMPIFCNLKQSGQSDLARRINAKLREARLDWKGPWSRYTNRQT